MPPPFRTRPSSSLPGAIDVEQDDGSFIPLDPAMAASVTGAPLDQWAPPQAQYADATSMQPPASIAAPAPVGVGAIMDATRSMGPAPQSPAAAPSAPMGRPVNAGSGRSVISVDPDAVTYEGGVTVARALSPTAEQDAQAFARWDQDVARQANDARQQRAASAVFRQPPAQQQAAHGQAPMGTPITVRSGGGGGIGRTGRDVGQTFRDEQTAVEGAATARAGAAGSQAEHMRQVDAREVIENERAVEQHRQQQSYVMDEIGKLERMSAEVASRSVSPREVFVDRDAGSQVSAAIAMGLGAMGSALTGGPNMAAQIINEAIDRDLAVQRENADRDMEAQGQNQAIAERGVERQGQALERRQGVFEDEEQWTAAQKIMRLESAERQLQALMADAQTEEQRAAGQQMIAQLERQRLMAMEQFRRAAAQRAETRIMTDVGGVQVPLTTSQYVSRVQHLEDRARQAPAAEDINLPGARVADQAAAARLSPADRSKAREITGAAGDYMDALSRLRTLRAEHGTEFLDRGVVREAEMQRLRAARALGVVEGAGAFGDQEREFYLSRIPDPTALSGSTDAALDAAVEAGQQSLQARLRPFGYEPETARTSSFRRAGQ